MLLVICVAFCVMTVQICGDIGLFELEFLDCGVEDGGYGEGSLGSILCKISVSGV